MPLNLQPKSVQSAVVLPATGTASQVATALAYGIYSTPAFISGAVDQVAHTYNKLGGNVLDLEIQPRNVYSAYEEACLEYSYLINSHQSKNVLFELLGATTGSFDQDGEFTAYADGITSSPQLKYPKFQLRYLTTMGKANSTHIGVGASDTIYSASFTTQIDKQDYDLQGIIYTASLDPASDFYNQVGDRAINVIRVYYKTPSVMWNFFGGYPVGTVGNLSTYGMYADDSTFQLVPAWQNVLQAYTFEEDMHVRASHYSFRINNNYLRLFPTPDNDPTKFWVDFRPWDDPMKDDPTRKYGVEGINNVNTLPFPNIPYMNINSIGKQWIRRYALALAKETLGQVRSKLAAIPIPNAEVTLNGPALVTEAKEEQVALRDELKAVLDEMVYSVLAEKEMSLQNSLTDAASKVPVGIFVG
jgi:hypothetical protein